MSKKFLILFIAIIGLIILFFILKQKPQVSITPEKKPTPSPNIIVEYPQPNDIVKSPLVIKGKAKGTWYFEGSFPVTLYYDKDAKIASYASAIGEWMTEEYVPFETTIEFPAPTTTEGKLVLSKDNPSDIRELDEEITIPIKFRR